MNSLDIIKYFEKEFDKLAKIDSEFGYKIKSLKLAYGEIEDFNAVFNKKLKSLIFNNFKLQYQRFIATGDFAQMINIYNEFINYYSHLPKNNRLYHLKYLKYEKLMLEGLQDMQLSNCYKLSDYPNVNQGILDIAEYLLPDDEITHS